MTSTAPSQAVDATNCSIFADSLSMTENTCSWPFGTKVMPMVWSMIHLPSKGSMGVTLALQKCFFHAKTVHERYTVEMREPRKEAYMESFEVAGKDRAGACHAGGREFESRRSRHLTA